MTPPCLQPRAHHHASSQIPHILYFPFKTTLFPPYDAVRSVASRIFTLLSLQPPPFDVRSPHIPHVERLGTNPFNTLQIQLSRCRLYFIFFSSFLLPSPSLTRPTSPSQQHETHHHTPSRSCLIAVYSLHFSLMFLPSCSTSLR